jgi:hypothetical protein
MFDINTIFDFVQDNEHKTDMIILLIDKIKFASNIIKLKNLIREEYYYGTGIYDKYKAKCYVKECLDILNKI